MLDPFRKDASDLMAYMDRVETSPKGPYNTSILRKHLVDRQNAVDGDTRGLFSSKPFKLRQLKRIMFEQVRI